MPGDVPHTALPAILAAADVMALASASEGLANAWVEAMACGTPVVAPDIDGAREAVDHPSAGPFGPGTHGGRVLGGSSARCSIIRPRQKAVRANAARFAWRHNTLTLRDRPLRRIEAGAWCLVGHPIAEKRKESRSGHDPPLL